MKITKFEHSCLLVEMPAPINRTALFDPGEMSDEPLDIDALEYLDDIIITHQHSDHFSLDLVKKLVSKFPDVRITAPQEVVEQLSETGIEATAKASVGIEFFDAPHEDTEPLFPLPDEIGVHFLNLLSHPGDSHSFHETKPILALPITAPWGSTVKGINLALQLRPKYIIPIHDWHWKHEVRENMYNSIEKLFNQNGITFFKMKNGEPIIIDV